MISTENQNTRKEVFHDARDHSVTTFGTVITRTLYLSDI